MEQRPTSLQFLEAIIFILWFLRCSTIWYTSGEISLESRTKMSIIPLLPILIFFCSASHWCESLLYPWSKPLLQTSPNAILLIAFARVINNANINYRGGKFSHLEHVFLDLRVISHFFIKYISYYHFHWHKPKVKSQWSKKKLKKTENINILRVLSHTTFCKCPERNQKWKGWQELALFTFWYI